MFRFVFTSFLFALAASAALPDVQSTKTTATESLVISLAPVPRVGVEGNYIQDIAPGCNVQTNWLIAPAPKLAQTLTLTREQIMEAIRGQHRAPAAVAWSGSQQVRVTRKTRPFEEPELRTLLTTTLQRDFVHGVGELELRLAQPWTAATVPDEPIDLKIVEVPVAGVTPNFIARFELRSSRESVGVFQVPVQAKVLRELWVARSMQPRGRLLRDADLVLEKRDILVIRDAFLAPNLDDTSLELGQSLSPGAPLLTRAVRLRPVVLRGKVLDAVVMSGPLEITVKVEALEDGIPGQMIRVRNAKSKREFRGRVQNESTINVPI